MRTLDFLQHLDGYVAGDVVEWNEQFELLTRELLEELETLQAEHREELKKAWIDGSDANYKALKEAGKLKE
jgi:hypothetical protein